MMRSARLRWMGRPSSANPSHENVQDLPIRRPQVFGKHSQTFEASLLEWHQRNELYAAAIFAADGAPLATTESYNRPVLGQLAPYLVPLTKRIWYNDWELGHFSLYIASKDKKLSQTTISSPFSWTPASSIN